MDGEIVARVERRRQWTPREKAALMAEVEAEGGQVSVVAGRHGIRKACCTIGDRRGKRLPWPGRRLCRHPQGSSSSVSLQSRPAIVS